MSDKGWIKLHRSIRNNWLYKERRTFSRFEAWIDLLLEANHKSNRFPLGNEIVECERGQLVTSIRKLEDRWNWSNTKVKNFLNLLQEDKMIAYFSDTKKTVITIEKYDLYQSENDTETFQEHHESDTKTTREHTNKNVKNVKNDKEDIYSPVIEYLNEKAKKNFSSKSKSTQTKISARCKEGFTLDDFKKVIDNKCSQWQGTDMEKYLRPETLFGTKFESYLNENSTDAKKVERNQVKNNKNRFHNFEQRSDKYTADQLEEIGRKKMEKYLNKMKQGAEE